MVKSILLPDAIGHKNYHPDILEKVREMTFEQFKLLHDIYLVDQTLMLEEIVEMVYGHPSGDFVTQSDTVEKIETSVTENEDEQNVHFADAQIETDLVIGKANIDPSFDQGLQENGNLADFLSRPVKIYSITWAVEAPSRFLDVFNPWELFLSNPKVLNKIETFKLLHGVLKLKIVVNGSPFHYGRVIVGVRPTAFDNNTVDVDPVTPVLTTNYYDTDAAGYKFAHPAATLYSQRPHIFVDPSTNQPSHINWPFFCKANFLDLTDPDWIDQMGRLEVWELNTLKHNNGATDPLTINFYAWMEDVTLTGLTQSAPAVSQSGNEYTGGKGPKLKNSKGKDEYANSGILSTPASALSSYAGYFTNIPYIGKYAKATKMAAGSIADIARLFGFSRPPVLDNVTTMRPQTISNMANYSGGDALIKLTLDPKQELTVDPSTVGLDAQDQMSFGYVIKKEAFIDQFTWASNDFTGTQIYALKVHPLVAPKTGSGTSAVKYQTPVGYIARPFKYWTGSLCYRFQIVASAFHRGRIAIVYEPSPSSDVTLQYNSRYVHVIDLAESKDFKVEVKWSQAVSYLDTTLTASADTSSGDGSYVDSGSTCNGTLSVVVVNDLASSETSSNVQVNVFISGGDDFQVQDPHLSFTNYAYVNDVVDIGPPATTQSDVVTKDENMPEQEACYIINGTYVPTNPTRDLVHFGEQVVSIRSMLKRYCYHRTLSWTYADTQRQMVQYFLCVFPVGPGPAYGNSIASANPGGLAGATPYNVVGMTYLRYYGSAYIGYRGSTRWKAVLATSYPGSIIRVVRSNTSMTSESVNLKTIKNGPSTTPQTTNQAYLGSNAIRTCAGGVIASATVNPSVEYELPFYSQYKYGDMSQPAGPFNPLRDDGGYVIGVESYVDNNRSDSLLQLFSAAGEDFSFFFFIGAPPLVNSTYSTVTPS